MIMKIYRIDKNVVITIIMGLILLTLVLIPKPSLLMAFVIRIFYMIYIAMVGICILKTTYKRMYFEPLMFLIVLITVINVVNTGYGIYHTFDNVFIAHRVDGLYLIEAGELSVDKFLLSDPHIKGYPLPYIYFVVLLLIIGKKSMVHLIYYLGTIAIVLSLFKLLSVCDDTYRLSFAALISLMISALMYSILLVDKSFGAILFLMLLYAMKVLYKRRISKATTFILLIVLGLGTVLGSSLHNLIMMFYLLVLLIANVCLIKNRENTHLFTLLALSLASTIYYSIELYLVYYKAYGGVVAPLIEIVRNIVCYGTYIGASLGSATIYSYANIIRIFSTSDAMIAPWYLLLMKMYVIVTSLIFGIFLIFVIVTNVKCLIDSIRSHNVEHLQATLEQLFFLTIQLIGIIGQIGHYVGVTKFVDVGISLAINGVALYLYQHVLNYRYINHAKLLRRLSTAIAVTASILSLLFLGSFSVRVMSYAEAYVLPLYVTPYRSAYEIFMLLRAFLDKNVTVLLVREPVPTYHNNLLFVLSLLGINARAWKPLWKLDPALVTQLSKISDGTLFAILMNDDAIICLAK